MRIASSLPRVATGAALLTLLALAGCGGGSDDNKFANLDTPGGGASGAGGGALPQSATQSSAALFAYVKGLVGSPSETAAPVVLGDATLPRDETGPAATP